MKKFYQSLTLWQKIYIGGLLLVILSTILPWLYMVTSASTSQKSALSLWNLPGPMQPLTFFFLAPVGLLMYSQYRQYKRNPLSIFYKIIFLVLFTLLPSSFTMYVYMFFNMLQSLLHTSAFELFQASDVIQPGIGNKVALVGCIMVIAGVLHEIKLHIHKSK